MSDLKVLSEDEGARWVLDLLSDGERRTTREIEVAGEAEGVACPDSTIRFLSRMRHSGHIRGELSVKDKGWVWWRDATA